MGGINHQPCGGYLKNSTELSCALSVARAEFEFANAALEDALLRELRGETGTIKPIQERLRRSKVALSGALDALRALRQQMDANHYADLPSLQNTDLRTVGVRLAESYAVGLEQWEEISKLLKKESFYAVLDRFEEQIMNLAECTDEFTGQLSLLEDAARDGEISGVLEQNREGNIKVPFATLYNLWGRFQQEFLASSLISTELWYAYNDYGSLTDTLAGKGGRFEEAPLEPARGKA